jgi:predicted phage gp36 major capsid-like protein
VPEEIDAAIERTLTAISPDPGDRQCGEGRLGWYRKLVTTGGTPSGWVSETAGAAGDGHAGSRDRAAVRASSTPIRRRARRCWTMPRSTSRAGWRSEIATEFARAEGAAFVAARGQPAAGFPAAPTSAAGGRDAGRSGRCSSCLRRGGRAFAASNPQDRLIDLVQALRPPYRQGAVFVMNSGTAARIRKFKTADGAFLWQPGLVCGAAGYVARLSVVEAEDMPDVAADSLSIAFGNFRADI